MSTTIERIKSLRANREGRYHDLLIEAGACEGNGREFIHDDMAELDEVSRELGKSVKTLADDLSAAARWHALTRQLADAEDQKSGAGKTIARLSGLIKQAVADRNEANDARNVAKRRQDADAAKVSGEAYARVMSDIGRLQNEVKAARKPLAACEVLPKQLSELAALNPWLRVCADGG